MNPAAEIERARLALGLTDAEAAVVHGAATALGGEIEGWVARFVERAKADSIAEGLLREEATTLRLKRALGAWFHELLTLPYDAAYESARAEIGRTHVRIGLPPHLMVTSIGEIRRDVRRSANRIFWDDPPYAQRLADALGRVLDLELVLMLSSHGRRFREVEQQAHRATYVHRAEFRAARARTDAADAGACYLALLRRAPDPVAAARWAGCLSETLAAISRVPIPFRDVAQVLGKPPRPVSIPDLCARALAEVSLPALTEVEVAIEPPNAVLSGYEGPLRAAVVELLQSAANRDPGGRVRLAVTVPTAGGLEVEVVAGGPRWSESVRTIDDAHFESGGAPAVFTEFLLELCGGTVQLLRPPSGGAGVRVRLFPLRARVAS